MERTEEQELRAEGVAYGLFVLDAPLHWDHPTRWEQLPDLQRDLFMARARFVLTTADNR